MPTSCSNTGHELFLKVVETIGRRKDPNEELNLKQIANLVLGSGTPENASIIGHVLNDYGAYFKAPPFNGYMWRVKWSAVKADYPELFSRLFPEANGAAVRNVSEPVREMTRALDDEIDAVRKELNDHPIKVISTSKPMQVGTGFLMYQATVDLERDSDFPLPEGVGVKLRWPRPIQPSFMQATLLSYDPAAMQVYLELEIPLTERQRESHYFLLPSVEELLRAVQVRIDCAAQHKDSLVWRILEGSGLPSKVVWAGSDSVSGVDETQYSAIKKCLSNDISFVWGPPGTGKTHTIARLITSAALSGKKVLAASIANVAVDQIASQLVKALVESGASGQALLNEGRILRFGYARLPEVTAERRLFPNLIRIQELRKQLHDLRQQHRKEQNAEKRAVLQKAINDVASQIRTLTRDCISQSAVVLTTAVQTCIEPAIAESMFDLVVIDEASMMSLPYVTAVGMLAKERIVITGDFQQLGPISLAQTELAHKWLHKDPFGHVGIDDDHAEHAALSMLMSQRRMHSGICDLVNKRFYRGKLITNVMESRTRAKDFPPLPGESAVFVSVLPSDGSKVEQTPESSRRNRRTAEIVVGLVRKYLSEDPQIQIGVISPYRGQVSLIKRKLKDLALNESDNQRVRVGTVHAFQGAEADLIIWDLVDSRNLKVGKLFHSSSGNRLANVAITRAQGKLVFVGDRDVFLSSPGSEMVDKFQWILKTDLHPDTDRFVQYSDIADWISA